MKEDKRGPKFLVCACIQPPFRILEQRNTRLPLWEGRPEARRVSNKNVKIFFPPLSNFDSQRLLIFSTSSNVLLHFDGTATSQRCAYLGRRLLGG